MHSVCCIFFSFESDLIPAFFKHEHKLLNVSFFLCILFCTNIMCSENVYLSPWLFLYWFSNVLVNFEKLVKCKTSKAFFLSVFCQVYLSLLRMYLSPPDAHCLGPIKMELSEPQANLQAALQVLELHHSKLNTTKVRISPFIIIVVRFCY